MRRQRRGKKRKAQREGRKELEEAQSQVSAVRSTRVEVLEEVERGANAERICRKRPLSQTTSAVRPLSLAFRSRQPVPRASIDDTNTKEIKGFPAVSTS
jgi:hypothetical protein